MANKQTILIVGGLIVVAMSLIGAWALSSSSGAGPLTEVGDPAVIQDMIKIGDVNILTSENFVGHRIRVIQGWLKNGSDKPIRMVEVKFTFTDFEGKPVQDSIHRVFEPRQRPIDPGMEYRFDVNFENLPRTWNYRIPITEIAKIGY